MNGRTGANCALQDHATGERLIVRVRRDQHQPRFTCKRWSTHERVCSEGSTQCRLRTTKSTVVESMMTTWGEMSIRSLRPQQSKIARCRCRFKNMRSGCEKACAGVRNSVQCA